MIESRKKRILVTGGAGFIGSHLVDRLILDGHKVSIIDNLSSGSRKNLNSKASFYKLDISNKKIAEVFDREKPEVVFHLAAQANLQKSILDPVADSKTNILGFINICKNCKEFGVKKIIFSSSAAVYGDGDQIPTKEGASLKPVSPYGVAKLTGEQLLALYREQFNIEYVALRYSNVYGPRQGNNGEGGVVSIFFNRIKNNEKLIVYGSGNQTRDFIFVDDVVRANICAMLSKQSGIFNISSAKETSVRQLIEEIKLLTKRDVQIIYAPARSGDQARSALDYSLAEKVLDWSPKYTLRNGLKESCDWFLGTKGI